MAVRAWAAGRATARGYMFLHVGVAKAAPRGRARYGDGAGGDSGHTAVLFGVWGGARGLVTERGAGRDKGVVLVLCWLRLCDGCGPACGEGARAVAEA